MFPKPFASSSSSSSGHRLTSPTSSLLSLATQFGFALILLFGFWYPPTVLADNCICNVRFVGEYCGTTLNEKNGGGNCTNHMYFCGKSNLAGEGVILKNCVTKGFECDKKLNGGNACYQNVKCLCGQNLARKRKYCGNELTGPDCQPNIVYRCPMIRRYNPSPEDACPNGCLDGKCL